MAYIFYYKYMYNFRSDSYKYSLMCLEKYQYSLSVCLNYMYMYLKRNHYLHTCVPSTSIRHREDVKHHRNRRSRRPRDVDGARGVVVANGTRRQTAGDGAFRGCELLNATWKKSNKNVLFQFENDLNWFTDMHFNTMPNISSLNPFCFCFSFRNV